MGKFNNKPPKPSNWSQFDQELMHLSNDVKKQLENKIENLREMQRDLEIELAFVEEDIEDLKKAKNLVKYQQPRRAIDKARLFLDNLHYTINESDLERYFGRYGDIVQLFIVRSRLTKLSRGYGYVKYSHESMAEDAMADGADEPHMLHGRYINTQYAYEQPSKWRSSGRGGKPY